MHFCNLSYIVIRRNKYWPGVCQKEFWFVPIHIQIKYRVTCHSIRVLIGLKSWGYLLMKGI